MRKALVTLWMLATSATLMAQANFQVTLADKQRIVTGSQEFQKDDRIIFANALLWAVEQGAQLKEQVEDCDFDKLRLTMTYNIVQEGASSFASKLTLQVGQGRLVYLVSDIKGQAPGLTGVLGATAFDKMNPEKKPKQKTMIEEFERANKKVLTQLIDYVAEHDTDVSFWKSIATGRIEKGMSPTDILMILGKPIDIQKSGDTVQYMYNTFTYVFFEDDRVKSFMQ